jgi:hypothetical protein
MPWRSTQARILAVTSWSPWPGLVMVIASLTCRILPPLSHRLAATF